MKDTVMFVCVRSAYIILTLLVMVGCAHIPKESVLLSEELTNMTISSRDSHLAMVEEYMAERRKQADSFLKEKWVPDFMAEFFTSSGLLDSIEAADTDTEKAQITQEFTEAAAEKIYTRRATLMDSLDEIERLMKEAVLDHYAQMLMVNQALTAHLRSAAEITETRKELLDQLQIEPTEILPIKRINESIVKILNYEDELEDLPNIVNEITTILNRGQ